MKTPTVNADRLYVRYASIFGDVSKIIDAARADSQTPTGESIPLQTIAGCGLTKLGDFPLEICRRRLQNLLWPVLPVGTQRFRSKWLI